MYKLILILANSFVFSRRNFKTMYYEMINRRSPNHPANILNANCKCVCSTALFAIVLAMNCLAMNLIVDWIMYIFNFRLRHQVLFIWRTGSWKWKHRKMRLNSTFLSTNKSLCTKFWCLSLIFLVNQNGNWYETIYESNSFKFSEKCRNKVNLCIFDLSYCSVITNAYSLSQSERFVQYFRGNAKNILAKSIRKTSD